MQRFRKARLESVRELQIPFDRLEVGLIAQGIDERVDLQQLQARITQAHCGIQPFERLGQIDAFETAVICRAFSASRNL